ncbi:MAG: hypothetical protein HY401_06230 [Elusimicrobia bacterium]|nr:hypothetical protein [Elusimicrobiota bacterium]
METPQPVDLRWLSFPYSFEKAKLALEGARHERTVLFLVDACAAMELKNSLETLGCKVSESRGAGACAAVVLAVEKP